MPFDDFTLLHCTLHSKLERVSALVWRNLAAGSVPPLKESNLTCTVLEYHVQCLLHRGVGAEGVT